MVLFFRYGCELRTKADVIIHMRGHRRDFPPIRGIFVS